MRRWQSGISLSEILIGLFLSSLITAALINQFLGVKKHYKHINRLIEEDTEVQLVIDLMRGSIQRAGFAPCLGINQLTTADRLHNNHILKAIRLKGAHQPVLQTSRMSETFGVVESFVSTSELLTPTSGFKLNQVVVIADCFHAEVQQISAIRRLNGQLIVSFAHPFLFDYQMPVYIGEWITEQFYTSNHKKNSSLFYKRHRAEALTPYVKSLSFEVSQHKRHESVTVVLGLDNEKQKTFRAFVRS